MRKRLAGTTGAIALLCLALNACQNPLGTGEIPGPADAEARVAVSGTTRIEAESWSAMNGVQTEACSEGGQNVGWVDAGDWLVYPVTLASSGRYTITYRYAAPGSTSLSADLNAGATVLGTVALNATGGWQNWQTASQTVNLNAGTWNLGIFAQTGGWNLNWIEISPAGDGNGIVSGRTYRIVSQVSGKVLDVDGVSSADGANVHQWTWVGGANQKWVVEDVGAGYYRLIAAHSGKVLDVAGNSSESGANVHQWPWNGLDCQRWQIQGTGNGWTRVVAKNGGKVLDVSKSGTADGVNVQVYNNNDSSAQRWQFIEVDPVVKPDTKFGKQLVWRDEFDYSGAPAGNLWDYDLGAGGWGNNELQTYTNNRVNSNVANGVLTIKAVKDGAGSWSSARLVSRNKGDWTYGYYEVRAKLPVGRGTWPAIWMLPTDRVYGSWPKSGEIDIMEHVGYDQDVIHTTIHTEAYNHMIGTQKVRYARVNGVSTDFHTYGILWEPQKITWYVDGQEFFSVSRAAGDGWAQWPFDQRFHLLLNVAMGGNWGGAMGMDPALTSAAMDIDYVRIYQ